MPKSHSEMNAPVLECQVIFSPLLHIQIRDTRVQCILNALLNSKGSYSNQSSKCLNVGNCLGLTGSMI